MTQQPMVGQSIHQTAIPIHPATQLGPAALQSGRSVAFAGFLDKNRRLRVSSNRMDLRHCSARLELPILRLVELPAAQPQPANTTRSLPRRNFIPGPPLSGSQG